jgi:hypothetical protein
VTDDQNTEPFCNHDPAAITHGVCECGYILEAPTRFLVTIECDNDAFVDNPNAEVARILKVVVHRVKEGERYGNLHDINGNYVGDFAYETSAR